mmetsp:Transcript_76795/g.205143  ORF Transcript_76795/g.205143 Transcript_76795/m.205143 type:complete len:317 (+) Transcript_76795:2352-3302(+)
MLWDAVKRIEPLVAKYSDVPLYHLAMSQQCLPSRFPKQQMICWLGCGATMVPAQFKKHEREECPNRAFKCTNPRLVVPEIGKPPKTAGCGVHLMIAHQGHHGEVEENLRAALQTWNHETVYAAIQDIVPDGHPWFSRKSCFCPRCQFSPELVKLAEARARRLQRKWEIVEPINSRGNIFVNRDDCSVQILRPLPFENRKPPDTSAKLEPGVMKEALLIISNLAKVIKEYMVPMYIEGHTGATEPQAFWEELAQNRSQLLVDMLEEQGVPPGLAIARGVPGGGAKVLVKPCPKDHEEEDGEHDHTDSRRSSRPSTRN